MKGTAISLLRSAVPRSVPKAGRLADRVRARLDRPVIDRADCTSVLRDYGLRVASAPRNFGHGWRNDIVTVKTNDGLVVLKRYPSRWSEAAIEHEHSILRRLEDVGFPAVRLRRATAGQTWAVHADAFYVVFEFSRGRNVTGCRTSPAQHRRHLAMAGSTLARFHRAMEGFEPTGVHHIAGVAAAGHHDVTLAWRTALGRLVSQPPESLSVTDDARPQLEWLCNRAGPIDERLAELDSRIRRAHLNRHVIHGDFGLHNLLFRGDGTAVLHDFELARVDYRLVDLAGVLSRAETDPADVFVESYRAESAITAEEWAHLPAVWELSRLCGAVRSWENYTRYGDPRRLHTARRRIDEAARIRAKGLLACR